MGKVNSYNNLSLEKKLEYWKSYLQNLITWKVKNEVANPDQFISEIERVKELIEVLDPSGIYETTIESRINSGKSLRKKKDVPKKTIAIKLKKKASEDYQTVYRYRYDSSLRKLISIDEDRSKET